jgi:hypothetical protein
VKEDLIRSFPTKRVSPFDGMAVTADAWTEAHEYHRQRQQLHALFSQGAGIVTGLQVIASDPPDSAVYILPGIAVDPEGQVIVLPTPRAYNIGHTQGYLYLLLTYGQSGPRSEEDQPDGLRYLYDEFGIQATPILPKTPYVELARFQREGRDASIADAQDATHPGTNEIDLRFRKEIGASAPQAVRVAVRALGDEPAPTHYQGISYAARACRRSGPCQVWVDEDVSLDDSLAAYDLIYLVGQSPFQLDREAMNAIYAYLQDGGTVLYESCRKAYAESDPPADASFADLLGSFGIELGTLGDNHDLLREPCLFGAPPPGFETGGSPSLQTGGGVIVSTYDYGCLWRGARRDGPASREQIRTAMEWASNLFSWAQAQRRPGKGKQA